MGNDIEEYGDLDELYQQTILDHNRSPRNFHVVDDATGTGEGLNPVCGDHVTISLKIEDDRISDIGFTGKGCAICMASASMMTLRVKGESTKLASSVFEQFHHMLTEEDDARGQDLLDNLVVFAGVKRFPIRVKCATLPWHTMMAALQSQSKTVSTEHDMTEENIPDHDNQPGADQPASSDNIPPSPDPATSPLKDKIIENLQTVFDPEIPVNIYELGLIYDVDVDTSGDVQIKMTLTSPSCPAAQELPIEVQRAAAVVNGVGEVDVDVVFDPPWNPDKMSEAARLQLGMM